MGDPVVENRSVVNFFPTTMSGFRPGYYPQGYNPQVHGPYLPYRYYGKPDTPLGDVKLGDLKSWVGRRDLSPNGFVSSSLRVYEKWVHKFFRTQKYSVIPYLQGFALFSTWMFFARYSERSSGGSHAKYH